MDRRSDAVMRLALYVLSRYTLGVQPDAASEQALRAFGEDGETRLPGDELACAIILRIAKERRGGEATFRAGLASAQSA